MGYSVTMIAERRTATGTWEEVGNIDRHAPGRGAVFGVLGFDNDYGTTPIVAARGIPADASATVRGFFDVDDHGYDKSWLTLAELIPHRDRLGDDMDAAMAELATFGAPDDVRIVFGFYH